MRDRSRENHAAGAHALAGSAERDVGWCQLYADPETTAREPVATVRSDDYDMRRDFQSARRRLVAAPALALTRPVVDASHPLVEGVLLHNSSGKRRAVTLANWAYRASAIREDSRGRQRPIVSHAPVEGLKVTIRGAGKVSRATSCMLDRRLKSTTSGEAITVTLPRLEEGDVVLLE